MRLLILVPLIWLLLSCSTQKEIVEVPVEVIKTEYIYTGRVDSIYTRDSIDRYVKGDTVFIYKEHTKFRYIDRVDSIIKVDTIPKIIKVETVKEIKVNHINWYQKVLMWIGGVTALAALTILIYRIKFRK